MPNYFYANGKRDRANVGTNEAREREKDGEEERERVKGRMENEKPNGGRVNCA